MVNLSTSSKKTPGKTGLFKAGAHVYSDLRSGGMRAMKILQSGSKSIYREAKMTSDELRKEVRRTVSTAKRELKDKI